MKSFLQFFRAWIQCFTDVSMNARNFWRKSLIHIPPPPPTLPVRRHKCLVICQQQEMSWIRFYRPWMPTNCCMLVLLIWLVLGLFYLLLLQLLSDNVSDDSVECKCDYCCFFYADHDFSDNASLSWQLWWFRVFLVPNGCKWRTFWQSGFRECHSIRIRPHSLAFNISLPVICLYYCLQNLMIACLKIFM